VRVDVLDPDDVREERAERRHLVHRHLGRRETLLARPLAGQGQEPEQRVRQLHGCGDRLGEAEAAQVVAVGIGDDQVDAAGVDRQHLCRRGPGAPGEDAGDEEDGILEVDVEPLQEVGRHRGDGGGDGGGRGGGVGRRVGHGGVLAVRRVATAS
jgi:hypothetical protein